MQFILMFAIRWWACRRVHVTPALCCHRWILHGSALRFVDQRLSHAAPTNTRLLAFRNQHPKCTAATWQSRPIATKIFEHRPPFWLHSHSHRHRKRCHLWCWIASVKYCMEFHCLWKSVWIHCRMHSVGCSSKLHKSHSKSPKCRNTPPPERPNATLCEWLCKWTKRVSKIDNLYEDSWINSITQWVRILQTLSNKTRVHLNLVFGFANRFLPPPNSMKLRVEFVIFSFLNETETNKFKYTHIDAFNTYVNARCSPARRLIRIKTIHTTVAVISTTGK